MSGHHWYFSRFVFLCQTFFTSIHFLVRPFMSALDFLLAHALDLRKRSYHFCACVPSTPSFSPPPPPNHSGPVSTSGHGGFLVRGFFHPLISHVESDGTHFSPQVPVLQLSSKRSRRSCSQGCPIRHMTSDSRFFFSFGGPEVFFSFSGCFGKVPFPRPADFFFMRSTDL